MYYIKRERYKRYLRFFPSTVQVIVIVLCYIFCNIKPHSAGSKAVFFGSMFLGSSCLDGDVRLSGGEDESEGRLELCSNALWGTVCSNGWDLRDATVVCKQLGYRTPSKQYEQLKLAVWAT